MTKLSGALPKGGADGLGAMHGDLVANPQDMHVIIAIADCCRITTDTDTGEVEPTARIRRIEVVDPAFYPEAEKMLRHAIEIRTGQQELPFEMEDDLQKVFSVVTVTKPRPRRKRDSDA